MSNSTLISYFLFSILGRRKNNRSNQIRVKAAGEKDLFLYFHREARKMNKKGRFMVLGTLGFGGSRTPMLYCEIMR